MYKIAVLGSGGREHCLCWKIGQSSKCSKLYAIPGNAGTARIAQNINLDILDFKSLESFVDENSIDYIIVGPEAPLVEGIYDYFKPHKVKILGPSAKAAMLEGSKAFANDFMKEFNIPTAGFIKVGPGNIEEGFQFIDAQKSKIVLKADGLAAGKGVLILDDKNKAKNELKAMLDGKFGKASSIVVIEEFLDGIEFSVFVLTDGNSYKILPVAKDYKRIGEDDTGLNTGGMGAVSPVPFVDDDLMAKVEDSIIKPTLKGIQAKELDYKGFIFLGLIVVENNPFVIEYNCRMGDPETQAVIPRLKNDLVDLIEGVFNHQLEDIDITIDERSVATVVLVSGGYPEKYEKNKKISMGHLDEDTLVFQAGTKMDDAEQILTNGGRVLALSSFGSDFRKAISKSMNAASAVNFEKMYYRKDIGFDL